MLTKPPATAALEAITPGTGGSFAARRFRAESFPFKWHYHPEFELTLIVRGRGMRFVGTSIESFSEGDLVLIGTNVPHTWQSASDVRATESMVVQFSPDLLSRLDGLPEMRRIIAALSAASAGLVISADTGGEVTRLIEQMCSSTGSGRSLGWLLCALSEVAEAWARGAEKRRDENSGVRRLGETSPDWSSSIRPGARKLQRALNRMQGLISRGEEVRQSDFATFLGMSPSTFSRMFHRELGVPFSRYVNEWRVSLAAQALAGTGRSITEIAFECGFGNLSNFNRRFREIKGMPPRQFRAMASA